MCSTNPGRWPEGLQVRTSQRYLFIRIVWTILHKSYGTHMGAHQPVTNEENVCVQNSIFSYKELTYYLWKWGQWKIITLNDLRQWQIDKHHMFSLIFLAWILYRSMKPCMFIWHERRGEIVGTKWVQAWEIKWGEEESVKEGHMGVNEHCPGGKGRERKSWQHIKIIQKKKLYLHWIAVDNLCHRSLTLHWTSMTNSLQMV